MNKHLGVAAFLLGLLALGWVGFGYLGSNPLALTMTALIAAFYLMGGLELRRFHQASASLGRALADIPENLPRLADWLAKVDPSLQNAVRLRVEGERSGLPGPAMTPYLVGLLVLLGMLGTFLGMVVTLGGAVMALESTTDLPTMRAALAAPVKGLGLAFGTSVAGVAASAMLGLVSALCRRERLQLAQVLDSSIATALHGFSLAHQRRQTLETLQSQARAMPELVDRLQAMMAQLERQGEALNERLLASQEGFYRHARAAYSDLAASVDQSLGRSLAESARAAGTAIQPVVEATMAAIARQSTALHEGVADKVQTQLDGLSARFDTTVTAVAQGWTSALASQERSSEVTTQVLQRSLQDFTDTFERRSASLLVAVDESQRALHQHLAVAAAQQQSSLTQSLEAMAKSLQREWREAGAQTLDRQEQICRTLEQTARDIHTQAEAHARGTIAAISGLMQTASEAPRAAAEVIAQLRQKLSDSIAGDNALLEERSRIMATLSALLDAVNQAATEQRAAIAGLVASAAALLQQAGTGFADKVEAESAKLSAVASQVTGSAVELSSLGEAFGHGVQLFGDSSAQLIAQLQRIESALARSTERSDDQLAYYVAQAREIIDLSIVSQKQIVEDLQQLARRQGQLAGEVG